MASDYSNIGLNQNLFGTDSPAITKSIYTTSEQFDSSFEGLSAVKLSDAMLIAQRGTLTLSGTNITVDTATSSITHNLGYAPSFLAYTVSTAGSTFQPIPRLGDSIAFSYGTTGGVTSITGFQISSLGVVSTKNQLIFTYNATLLGGGSIASGVLSPWSFNIVYYIFRETAGSV